MSGDGKVGRVIPNAPLGPKLSPSPPPQRQRLYHTAPSWVPAGETYFITICCAERPTNLLATPAVFNVMTGALEHYIAHEKLWARLFLAMPDHVHGLLSFPRQERIEKIIRDWKRFVAKQTGVRWQDGFFDHRLRSNESLDEKSHYIRQNPVRAGLVSRPELWEYVWSVSQVAPAR